MWGRKLETSGVESHSSLSICERYHEYLRQIHRKFRPEHGNLDPQYVLPSTVRAMNVTAGRNGLSPCVLVFEVSPRIPTGTHNLPIQRELMMSPNVARSEMVKVMAKKLLTTALRRRVPKMTDHEVLIVSDVLLYKERPRNEWVGPYK